MPHSGTDLSHGANKPKHSWTLWVTTVGVIASICALFFGTGWLRSSGRGDGTSPPSSAPTTASGTANPGTSISSSVLRTPTDVTAIPLDPKTVRVRWTYDSTDGEGFVISNGSPTVVHAPANATSFELSRLEGGTLCFQVRSIKGIAESP